MPFKDYSANRSSNTQIGGDTFVGPNMPRNNVRPAIQQIMADGKELADAVLPSGNASDRAGKVLAWDAAGNAVAATAGGADSALRADVAATTGSLLMGWIRAATGAVVRTASSLFTERTPTPLDFIPFSEHAAIYAGTSTYDASDAIEKAAALFRGVHFPGKRYNITRPLDIQRCRLTGEAGSFNNVANSPTVIRATAAMDYMFKYTMEIGEIAHLNFDANNLAKACIIGEGCHGTKFNSLRLMYWKQSGLRFGTVGNNSASFVDNCVSGSGGTEYATGTATVSAGSLSTVAITGAADLTTVGVRQYYGWIKLTGATGKDARARMIMSISANQVTVYPGFSAAYTGAYKLLDGNCFEIQPNGDNSQILFDGGAAQSSKGVGIYCATLYAAHETDMIFEYLEYYWSIGIATVSAPYDFISEKSYTEFYGSAGVFNASNSTPPIFRPASAANFIEEIWTPATTYAKSPIVEWRGIVLTGQNVASTNATTLSAAYGNVYHITQTTNPLTVDLPPLATGTNKRDLMNGTDGTIVFVLHGLGGQTVTFKSADSTVNDVAGTTGIPITTGNQRLTACYGNSKWVVS